MINFPIYIPTGSPGDPYFYLDTLLIHGNTPGGYISTGTVIDSSTATNIVNIAGTGNITQGSVNPFGRYWSNYFNGTTDYLTMPDSSSLRLGGNNFTLECWSNITTLPANVGTSGALILAQKGAIGSNNFEWALVIYQFGGSYYFALQYTTDGSTVNTIGSSAITISPSTWNHYAITKSGSNLSLFVNGILSGSITIFSNFYTGSGYLSIANDPAGTSTFFNGYISNIRLVNGNALYTATFTPSIIPLTNTNTNNTVLLACVDNSMRDISTNSSVILAVGTPSVQRLSPWGAISLYSTTSSVLTGSIQFDGSTGYLYAAPQSAYTLANNDFTVEFWIKANSWSGTLVPFWQNDSLGASIYDKLWFGYTSNSLTIGQYGTSGLVQTPWTPLTNTWYHLAMIRSNSNFYLYINGTGQLLSTNTITTSTAFGQNGITIGASSGPYYFNGYISNFRFTNGTALYTANFPLSSTILSTVTNTVLLTAQSTQLINDISGNNFPISVVGLAVPNANTPFSRSNNTSTSALIYSGSYYFDGNTYLTVPSASNLTVYIKNFTAEAWIYLNQKPANTGAANGISVIQKGSIGTNTFEWALTVYQTGGTYYLGYLYSQDGVNVITTSSSAITLNANSWNHIALSKTDNNANIFLNGISVGRPSIYTYVYTGTGTIFIGYNPATSISFKGYMSNIRFVNGQGLYQTTFTPSIIPLIAVNNTNLLLLGTNSSVYDSTMQSNITTIGDVISTNAQTGVFGGNSLYFDGNASLQIPVNPNLFTFGGDFTVEFWFYSNTSTYFGHLFSTSLDYSSSNCLRMDVGNFNNTVQVAQGVNDLFDSPTAFNTATWTHFAVVRTGTNLIMYQSGNSVGSIVNTTTFICDTMIIGDEFGFNGPYAANGYINEFRVTNGLSRYAGNFTPTTSSFLDFQIDPITLVSTVTSFTTSTVFGTGVWNYSTVTNKWDLIQNTSTVQGDITPMRVDDQINTSTGYFTLPAGTTLQRPMIPSNGYMRYNTTIDAVEYYSQGSWITLI